MTRWSDALSAERASAAQEATVVLIEKGFALQPSGKWKGELDSRRGKVAVEVVLPLEFPDKLPEIFLETPDNTSDQSHIEASGKICIASTGGNLLDTEYPKALLAESLAIAETVLCASEQEQRVDVQLEFVAYWPESSSDADIWSILDASRDSGEIVMAQIALNGNHLFFADSKESLKSWCGKTAARHSVIQPTFFAKLTESFSPPPFDQTLSTAELDELLKAHMSERAYECWRNWDRGRRPPPAILLSVELVDGSFAVFAARRAQLKDQQRRAIEIPYSRKRIPAKKLREALWNNAVGRRAVTRFDLSHLLQRTAGPTNLGDARVAIVGCGAVGSQIAVAAAASGVRFLTLVDHELMGAENIHRHALGTADVKKLKVIALTKQIERRYPSIQVIPKICEIENLFNEAPDILNEVDLFVFALGDETLERRLNSYLGPSVMRIHTWVEPLGLGGHCLVIPGGEQKGCYECMYARDENLALYNMASLCQRGQVFQRTTGGCPGTFTPFGYMDTLDAASRAVRILTETLTQRVVMHSLLSWIGNEQVFISAGYALSNRGQALLRSRHEFRDDIRRDDCRVCSSW